MGKAVVVRTLLFLPGAALSNSVFENPSRCHFEEPEAMSNLRNLLFSSTFVKERIPRFARNDNQKHSCKGWLHCLRSTSGSSFYEVGVMSGLPVRGSARNTNPS